MRREDRSGQHRLRRTAMKFRLLPLTLLAVFGLAIAAETNYPLDAPAPDGRRPGGTITQEFTPPKLHDEENKDARRSEEHTSELQSLMRISYAVFCLKKKKRESMTKT